MIRRTESVRIATPATEVWKLVGEPRSWPRWAAEVADVSLDGELGEGAIASYAYRGRRVTATITGYDPGRLLAIATARPSYELRESVALTENDGSTGVSITMAFAPTRWWGRVLALLLTPVSRLLLGRSLRRSLASLKSAAESWNPGRPP